MKKKPASQNLDQDHFRQSVSLRDPRFRDRLQRETGITITFWDEHPAEELHLDRAWWSIHPPEEIMANLKLLVLLCEKFGRYPYLLREQPEWRPHFLYDNPKWQRFAHDLDGYVRLCRLLAEVCRSRKINSKPLRELADWSEDWFKRFSQAEPKKWNEAHSEWKSRHDHVEAHIDRLRTRLALELKKGPQITAGEYEDDGRGIKKVSTATGYEGDERKTPDTETISRTEKEEEGGKAVDPVNKLNLGERAVALKLSNSQLRAKEIAAKLGCTRAALYRYNAFKMAMRMHKEATRRAISRGHKGRDGTIESYDERDTDD